MRVALAGPMGSGKSTVGALLAQRWGVPFVDLDGAIGDVAEIFRREGESAFRQREADVLDRCTRGTGVLALGGGTVVDPMNRARLAGWRVFVLFGSLETLRGRVGDGAGRPLAGALERLLVEREAAWRAAGTRVMTDGRTPEEVADRVEELCASR